LQSLDFQQISRVEDDLVLKLIALRVDLDVIISIFNHNSEDFEVGGKGKHQLLLILFNFAGNNSQHSILVLFKE
jgi:hypothetical protein